MTRCSFTCELKAALNDGQGFLHNAKCTDRKKREAFILDGIILHNSLLLRLFNIWVLATCSPWSHLPFVSCESHFSTLAWQYRHYPVSCFAFPSLPHSISPASWASSWTVPFAWGTGFSLQASPPLHKPCELFQLPMTYISTNTPSSTMEENGPNSTESTEICKNKHHRCVYSKGHSLRM